MVNISFISLYVYHVRASLIMSRIYLPGKVNIAFRFAPTCLRAKGGIILVIATVHYTRVYKEADTRGRNDRVLCTQFFLGVGSLGSSCRAWCSKSTSAARECVPRGFIKASRCPMPRWRKTLRIYILAIVFDPRYSLFLYRRVVTRNYYIFIIAIKNLDISTSD